MKIPQGLIKEILNEEKIDVSTLYKRIKKKKKDFGNMITEKQAACLIASQLGIDVVKYSDQSELSELRELALKERAMGGPSRPPEKIEKPKSRPRGIKVEFPYEASLDKYNLDTELFHDCRQLVAPNIKELRPAIREALLTLETRIRNRLKLGEDMVGKELVDKAKESGVFKRNVGSEEEGLYFLYRGAIQWLRNPPGHKKIEYNREEAIKIILFVDYLIKLFEKLIKENPPR